MPNKGLRADHRTKGNPFRSIRLAAAAAAAVVGVGVGHTAARAGTVTSTLPPSVRDYLWSNPSLWSNTPAAATYPNNGNLGNTYNVVLTGGSVDRDVNVIVNDLTVQGGTDLGIGSGGSTSLAVMGVLRVRNGSLGGLVTVPAGARVEFARTELESRNFIYGTFNLGGSASFATDVAGDFRIDPSGGSINIQSTGTLTVNRPLLLLPPNGGLETGGPAKVVNAGLIDQQVGQRMSWAAHWPVVNGGTIRVNAEFGGAVSEFHNTGLLDLQSAGAAATLVGVNSGTMSGQVRLAAGANLTLTGSYAVRNLSVTNAGTIHLTGATTIATPTTLPGGFNIATNTARLTLSADLTLTGPARLDGGALIQGAATTGTNRVTASDLTFGGATVNNAALAVPAGGTLRLAGAANHFLENATLVVNGAVDWTGGSIAPASGTSRVQVAADGRLSVAVGATVSLSGKFDNAGVVEVGRGGSLLMNNTAGSTLVNTGTVRASGGVVRTGSGLDPFAGNSGAFDLVEGGGMVYTSQLVTVADRIRAGYHGGAWDGPGVRSSAAQTDRSTAVGYAAGPSTPGTFMGLPVGPADTLVRHTKYGDATLDGIVNFDDLLALAKGYNSQGAHWYQGDFDYNRTVNFDDLLILAKNYNAVMPAAGAVPGATATFPADLAAAFAQAAVPEPSGVMLLGTIGAAAAVGRRRRQRAPRDPALLPV